MKAENERRLSASRLPPRTTCKICWCSVYESEPTEWVTSPAPGLAHAECAERSQTKED